MLSSSQHILRSETTYTGKAHTVCGAQMDDAVGSVLCYGQACQAIDAKRAQIDLVEAFLEIGDYVGSATLANNESVFAFTTGHGVVANTTGQNIVSGPAVELIAGRRVNSEFIVIGLDDRGFEPVVSVTASKVI